MTYESPKEIAKKIRVELKNAFPGVKFSVTSKNSAVRISWTDFPHEKRVREITDKYKNIHRCEVTGEILLGANTYVFAQNDWSDDVRAEIQKEMPSGHDMTYNGLSYWHHFNKIAEVKDPFAKKKWYVEFMYDGKAYRVETESEEKLEKIKQNADEIKWIDEVIA